jgi:hypothetical protein
MIQAGRRVREAGIFLSVTCLLGIAGASASIDHAEDTAAVLCKMAPSQIAILTLMLLDNTSLGTLHQQGGFNLPTQEQLFEELRILVDRVEGLRCQFQANHASNYFSLDGRLPKDKQAFLEAIEAIRGQQAPLKPECLRAL